MQCVIKTLYAMIKDLVRIWETWTKILAHEVPKLAVSIYLVNILKLVEAM